MNPEQLLIPRYVVIADYPGSKFKVGQIIEFVSRADKEFSFTEEWFVVIDGFAFGETWFQQWPHIFKALQWWEARMLEEMPVYVKNTATHMSHYGVTEGHLFKVKRWDILHEYLWFENFPNKPYFIQYVLPATEQEYIASIS